MSEVNPEAAATQEAAPAAGAESDPKVDETDWKAEARKWEQRAKDNSGAAKAAEKARIDAMSEQDRAIEEAKQSARTEATTSYGKRLARTEFDNLAGRRNPDFDTASALEFVDLGKFLGEDGEPDTKAIASAVERLVPTPATGPPSFDGGTRTAPPAPQGMSQLIRKAAGRA
jgi:hypothetical protein